MGQQPSATRAFDSGAARPAAAYTCYAGLPMQVQVEANQAGAAPKSIMFWNRASMHIGRDDLLHEGLFSLGEAERLYWNG